MDGKNLDRRESLRFKMDTTVLSEQDYINMLPDMDRMDIEESSFMKGGTSFFGGTQRQE